LTISLVSAVLLFSGCGDSTSEGESRLETQQMLDDGDYVGVIAKLESIASSYEDYILLGSAYMGKAGLSLTDIISAIATDNNSSDSFSGFVGSIASRSSSTAITDLSKAKVNYKNVVGEMCADVNATLNDSQKDICLYIGLSSTSQAAVSIDLLADDINAFGNDNADPDNKLTASICAMNYAIDGNYSTVDCNLTQLGSDITFTDTNRTYTPFTMSVIADTNATPYYYLKTDANKTALTKGFCTLDDFATRVDDYNATITPSLYACPVNEDKNSEDITSLGILTTALNEGVSSTGASASEETQADVDEFKCNVLGGNYLAPNCQDKNTNAVIDLTQTISEADVIKYLTAENN
jgi:hypothetical protein